MDKRNILFTFDYELFLGKRSGSVDKCVINPTENILSILSNHKAKAIFFVDMAWLVRLKEESANNSKAKEDYDKVVAQLQKIVKAGHNVFNHLHPHWLDAQYIADLNQWELDNYTRYRFTVLDKTSKGNLFAQTTRLLNEIIRPINPAYVADGYRAGGWSIQPFEDFKPYFIQHGIKYDFSVMSGMKSMTNVQQYDFTSVSTNQPYTFADDPCKPAKGNFAEFPINTISISSLSQLKNRILLKYLWKKGDRYSGDGHSASAETIGENISNGEMISIELLTRVKLPGYLNFLKRNEYMHFISHPKMLSEHNINTFAQFMNKAYALYSIESDFRKMLPQ